MGNEFQEAVKRLLLLRSLGVPSITPAQEPPLPSVPCGFPCGSREKIEMMRQRAESGQDLWHPLDAADRVSIDYESNIKAEPGR